MKSLLFLSQYIALACLLAASCDAKNANPRQNAIEQNTERHLGTSPPVHVKKVEPHHSGGGGGSSSGGSSSSSSGGSSGSSSSGSSSSGSSSSGSSSSTSGGTTSKATTHKAHKKQKGMLAVSLITPAQVPSLGNVGESSGNAHRNRRSTIVMDGKANAIRDRIKSVNNTKKITSAMKLVAAAKVRRAQDSVLATRPFSETLQSVFGGLINRLGTETADLPLLTQREVNKVTLVVITGDRGLCGGYNSFMIKKAEKRADELKSQGIDVDMILVGKKGATYFQRRDYAVRKVYDCGQNPTSKEALAISEEIINTFLSGETDAVELMYTKFVSLIASTPAVRTLVPFSASEISQKGDEVFQLTSSDGDFGVERKELEAAEPQEFPNDMIFEQDPLQIVNSILPLYLNGQILRTLQESVASELAARMQSMQAASDNAGALSKELNQVYNRARQASVTQEILEIVSGAAALE